MTFSEWLGAAPGRHKVVAEFFGVSVSAVGQWLANGVPMARMPALAALTKGEVSISEMVLERVGE
jgi:DNA-binding transcriptional regulator YdaS (Cro superfamily)